jgi:cyanophycin synthetase
MDESKLKLTNQLLIKAARERGWKVELLHEYLGVIRYTDKNLHSHIARSVLTKQTNSWQILVAKYKDLLHGLAVSWGVPVPETIVYENYEQAKVFLKHYQCVVVKPRDGAHGDGITTHITSLKQLQSAIKAAQKAGPVILLQKHIPGIDYRLLYIGGKYAAASIRHPAQVIGDAQHTVRELILMENSRPERNIGYHSRLTNIDTVSAKRYLGSAIDSVPSNDERLTVVGTANIGTGGTAEDVSDVVPQILKQYAEIVIEKLELQLCGIDFLYDEVTGPMLIEINTCPSFGLHALPDIGQSQPVADHFLDWLETLDGEI